MLSGIGRGQNDQKMLTIGQMAGSKLLTLGKVFFVKDAADIDYADVQSSLPVDALFNTISDALTQTRSGCADYVFLCPKDGAGAEPWTLSANLDMTKSTVHLIGISSGFERPLILIASAIGVRISQGATTYGIELGNVNIAGSGTTVVTPLQISGANAYSVFIHDCLVVNLGTTAAASEFSDLGKSLFVRDCIFGQNTAVHAAPILYAQGAGAGTQGVQFEGCIFKHFAEAAGDLCANIVTGCKDISFIKCRFINGNTAQVMTQAVTFADKVLTTPVAGAINAFFDCYSVGITTFGATDFSVMAPTIRGSAANKNPGLVIDGVAGIVA